MLQLLQEQLVIGLVVAVHARVTGGVHAGAAVQRVHLEAGIVRDGGAAGPLHQGLRLDQRVLLECLAGLLHVRVEARLLHGGDVEAVAQEELHLLELSEVSGGDEQLGLLFDDFRRLAKRVALRFRKLPDARLAQSKELVHLRAVKGRALRAALHLHKSGLAVLCQRHREVHVHFGAAVLGILKVQKRLAAHQPATDRRDLRPDRRIDQLALIQ